MKVFSYLRVGFNTTLNISLYAATLGKYLWLEGRVRRGVFRNWAGRFRYAPIMYVAPSEEEEIKQAVRNATKVRVFGAGHSFNEGNVSDQLLISLDNYSGLVSKDLANNQITVRGGTRVRDVVKLLTKDGLAFAALPSHDAQSIAGILSTDVHGLIDRLWLDAGEPDDPNKRQFLETLRQDPSQQVRLPGPYYRIGTGPLDLIAIDTGIDGTIDAAQGDWLRHISRGPKPKVLLTGKPIYVNGDHHPCPIDGGR